MNRSACLLLLGVFAVGCADKEPPAENNAAAVRPSSNPKSSTKPTLAEARRGFVTKPGGQDLPRKPLPTPPPSIFQVVKYKSPVGDLAAYVTPDPGDGAKHPAIVWVTGGDSAQIGDLWSDQPREEDESAAAYRKAGIVLMFPTLRGGHDNPGRREGLYGEVDDVMAAADYLAGQPYVDPSRIYLGGHSTGGTLAMLVAEIPNKYRAVFAFGPANDVRGYGGEYVYHAPNDPQESMLRSPAYWLHGVNVPLFVIEGQYQGNAGAVTGMKASTTNPRIRFLIVPGKTHMSVLAPANELIAEKILGDGPSSLGIIITDAEANAIGSR